MEDLLWPPWLPWRCQRRWLPSLARSRLEATPPSVSTINPYLVLVWPANSIRDWSALRNSKYAPRAFGRHVVLPPFFLFVLFIRCSFILPDAAGADCKVFLASFNLYPCPYYWGTLMGFWAYPPIQITDR